MSSTRPATVSENPIKLEFSEKYTPEHAEGYLEKHRASLGSRLSNWREIAMARKAVKLAGDPMQVLDLPCGAGRFWPMLGAKPGRTIIAADYSAGMLQVACKSQPANIVSRVTPLQTSAFAIDLPDAAVDCVFCMRLMHHIGEPANRMVILREFHRVTRDTAIISLWVDGNFKAWRRHRAESRRPTSEKKPRNNRFLLRRAVVEPEFKEAGFDIVGTVDFLPRLSMWRAYVLRKKS